MSTIFGYMASSPVLVLFLLIGIGMAIGHYKIKGINLGAAAVLFLAIAVSAWSESYSISLKIPHELGIFGLAIFTFAIGLYSGPNFFNTVRKSGGPILVIIVALSLGALIAAVVGGKLFHLSPAEFAGVFAGATNNTPALAAAGKASGNSAGATVGYSISYLYGVIGMLIFSTLALHVAKSDKDKPVSISNRTIRITRQDEPVVEQYNKLVKGRVNFSRLRRGETGPIFQPGMYDKLRHNDLLTIVGPKADLDTLTDELGQDSAVSLTVDREWLDYRRITVSNPDLAGLRLKDLNINETFNAIVSRVRRGDIDMVATPSMTLQQGDRVRVVAPQSQMDALRNYFGDSSRGLTNLNPIALGIGMTLGILIGEMPFFTPTGVHFSIGSAAGTLIVGLIFGKVGRIGPLITGLPYTSCVVLSEFGLLIFLAQAGTNAGGKIAEAFTGGVWWQMAILGFLITTAVGGIVFAGMRILLRTGGTKLSGALGGTQTQPAVLAYANERTESDPRVALGYAMVYPAAMVIKILIAQFLGSL